MFAGFYCVCRFHICYNWTNSPKEKMPVYKYSSEFERLLSRPRVSLFLNTWVLPGIFLWVLDAVPWVLFNSEIGGDLATLIFFYWVLKRPVLAIYDWLKSIIKFFWKIFHKK